MNNEEKILEMLEKQSELLEEHGEILKKHGDILAKHGDILAHLTEKVDELDARSLHSAVILETDVARDIRLVCEGQELLGQKMEKLTPKDRVEVLEGDVAMMKDATKLMRLEIAELKKAQ